MPKTIYTPRDELVCGKIDKLMSLLITPEQIDILQDIQYDCLRMEKGLIRSKDAVDEMRHYKEQAVRDNNKEENIAESDPPMCGK